IVVPMIPKGTRTPCTVEKTFFMPRDGMTEFDVELYQGEDSDPELCHRLATAQLTGLGKGRPKGARLVVRLQLEKSGRLRVAVRSGDGEQDQVVVYDPDKVLPSKAIDER